MPRKKKPAPAADPTVGHNSFDKDRLRNLVDRIQALEDERAGLAEDVRSIYAEAKAAGFNVPALHKIVRRRRHKPEQQQAREALQAAVDEYLAALGGLRHNRIRTSSHRARPRRAGAAGLTRDGRQRMEHESPQDRTTRGPYPRRNVGQAPTVKICYE